jgi:hypothetical protein
MRGDLNINTVNCDQTANTCTITVPAPSIALVFLMNDAFGGPSNEPPTLTFSTTASTNLQFTINPSVLATSNGHSGYNMRLGSTSEKKTVSVSGANSPRRTGVVVLFSMMIGGFVIGLGLAR